MGPSDIVKDEVLASTITPPAGCMMCSEIINLFHAPFDENDNDFPLDIKVSLGQVSERLADDCPHAAWLRDIKYSGGPIPYYEQRELHLYRWKPACNLNVHYHNRQSNVWASTAMFELVFRPEIPGHVGAVRILDESWIDLDVVKDWPSRCIRTHGEKCNKTVGNVPSFKPRLLIDVIQGCVTECDEDSPRFLTLSYTWGSSKNLRMTKAKVDGMKQPGVLRSDVIVSQLPRTILDAIKLTEALGERWLWVDSLCIIQDDDENLQHQLAAMHQIYATSFLTIIAADGKDAEYGLRGLRDISKPRRIKSVVLPIAGDERIAWVEDPDIKERNDKELSYDYRMWTSQEYDFSKRRMIFRDGQVKWECNCSAWSEDHLYRPQEKVTEKVLSGYLGQGSHAKAPSLRWFSRMLWEFNGRTLSYEEDVYNAFAGYNTYLTSIFPSGLVYGHPQIFFDISLCWTSFYDIRRRKVSERYKEDPMHGGLPSWSWMGWKGFIHFPYDSESEVGCSPNIGFTESITEWYAMESPNSCQKERINSVWSRCRKAPAGSMAESWICDEFKPPALTGGSLPSQDSEAVGIPKELPSHRYTCLLDGDVCPETRWYPIPVRQVGSEDEPPSGLHSGYQYLWCQTFRGILTATPDKRIDHREFVPYHLLKNKDGDTAGALLPHNQHESKLLHQDTQVELIAIARGWSTILKDDSFKERESAAPDPETPLTLEEEAVVREAHEEYWSDLFEEFPWMETWEDGKKRKQDGYHVLRIERENGVAYRKGCGFVLEEEWDRVAGTSRVDITLG
ncbi:unnamed protein product [Fusarium equiseti]|uniref:Heterokaryon incompatibility domain-containing protein n=1 Tax=Fusarium equiseti TaxID=61235 RepID=A0A8J2ITF8_FUSEQ|nr:unnamed protein product [Fusarium equiseti]